MPTTISLPTYYVRPPQTDGAAADTTLRESPPCADCAKRKQPCPGCRERTQAADARGSMPGHLHCHRDLQVITCHFNPAGYTRLVDNYWRFRTQFPAGQLTTVELSFDGRFEVPDAIHIRGDRDRHVMWQKERLLNIALEQVTAPYVAWIDADMLFLNPFWQQEAVEKLQRYRAVQLFARVVDTTADGSVEEAREGHVYAKQRPGAKWKRPGGAWAMLRDALIEQGGLEDHHVLGGSDAMMLAAWEANFSHALLSRMTGPWREFFLKCAAFAYRTVGGSLGYVSGDVVHLYHGTRANRNYVDRWRYLTDHDFDPERDLAIDDNGLWRWNSDKPEMHAKVARYFVERDEDR